MLSKVNIIIRREFMERVTKKSFIITTLLMPIVMLGLMLTPVLISMFAEGDHREVVVIDRSQTIAPSLQSNESLSFVTSESDDWQEVISRDGVDAVLVIPDDVVDGQSAIRLYTDGPSSMMLESSITSQVNDIIEEHRLKQYDIADLSNIIAAVHSDVSLQSISYDADGGEKESSTMLSYMLGIILTMLLYMCLLLYGQMVMTSIIEEKSNRVLELVVSSVKPMQLMLGKICGIGLVAVTQILIWTVLIAGMSAFVLPAILPAGVAAEMSALNAGTADLSGMTTDIGLLQALSVLGDVSYILQLFGLLLLFLIGGFMLYAAIYAAIGSAVDNIQDAGQLQSVVIFPIIIGIIFGMTAASDPTSTMSEWMSMIPFTSPMVMMARIPFGIPAWEIAVSLVILYASFFVMVWVAGKIYRVGIFMYGKKPSVKELIRWMRYK